MNRKQYFKKYHMVNKDRINAERRVKYGVSVGKIERGSCVECGYTGEHVRPVFESYDEPLKYKWICNICNDSIEAEYEEQIKLIEMRINSDKYYRGFK